MDSTRVTEQPNSHERPQPGVGPAEPRGALLRTPDPVSAQSATALPAQTTRSGDTPASSAAPLPCAQHGPSGTPGGTPTPLPAADGTEHSQPAADEPDAHRPRPAPESIPVQPDGEQNRPGILPGGKDRRTGQTPPPSGPMPMRRDGDRLRFVGAATRREAACTRWSSTDNPPAAR